MPLKNLKYELSNIVEIDGFGGIHLLDLLSSDFLALGYEIGDLVKVSFLNQNLILPVVADFNYLDLECSGLALFNLDANYLKLLNYGEPFALKYGLVERNDKGPMPFKFKNDIVFPVVFNISLYKKQGYKQQLQIFNLSRSNDVEDYSHITPLEFSNFREVRYEPFKPHTLYRGSSPIDSTLKRDKYIDDAIDQLGINTIINFTNREEKAKKFDNYFNTNYSKKVVLFEPLPIYFYDHVFTDKIVNTVRFMLANKPPYYVHCWEGKDRTGFFIMMLEALVGVKYEDIVNDYFLSFYNFFKVLPGSISYQPIISRVDKMLSRAFGTKELDKAKLPILAYRYFVNIGLKEDEVDKLLSLLKKS